MRICTSINTSSQAPASAPRATTGRRRPPTRSAVDGSGRPGSPAVCADPLLARGHRVIGCGAAERRHGITEEHLRAPRGVGMLEIVVPRAPTTVWQASRCNAAPVAAQVGLLTCAGLPHRRAGAAVGGDHAHMRRPGTWGSSPKVVTRLAGTLDRIVGRDGLLDPLPTPAQICATGVGGVDAHGDGLSLTQRLRRRRQRHPGCCERRPP